MVRTNKIIHSETTASGQTTPKKDSTDDQIEVVRRMIKVLTAFCVCHLILSVATATSLGVYVSEHVRYSVSYSVMVLSEIVKSRSSISSSIMSGWEKNTPILEKVLAFLRQKCRF